MNRDIPHADAPTADNFGHWVHAAWYGQLDAMQTLAAAQALDAGGQPALAAVLYRTWLDRHPGAPHSPVLLFNLGVLLFAQADYRGALQAYARALAFAPTFPPARFNLGLTYERLGDAAAAIAQWRQIEAQTDADDAESRPIRLLALNNLGRHFEDTGRLDDALECLSRSLAIEPEQPDVVHHWVFLRARQCVWPVFAGPKGLSEAQMREHTSAMAMISLSERPEEQLAAARHYVQRKLRCDVPPLAQRRRYGHRKLRIAYCSSDFCLHPVSMLTAELFELHDRSRFEVYGFDWSPEDGSALRQRVIRAMDHFERIHALDDEQAARLIREHEIDILVDLQGQTLGARANMLAWRPAPIQITYLGLPATTGLPFIDHVIADRYLIPPAERAHYSEAPLYMPGVYQVSDRQRRHAAIPTREACGLPASGFVFCCFNNNYKINPPVFDAWMRILQRVPGSVLWLLADNPGARANLQREAVARGIDAERLVFATRALPEVFLARCVVADLFLDTYPFNGGTTANDALWSGLPVLTRSGRTFAARMAGALLTAAGLPELIAPDIAAYEDMAVRLALEPQACAALRERLTSDREAGVGLFDTPGWVAGFERELERLVAELPA